MILKNYSPPKLYGQIDWLLFARVVQKLQKQKQII